MLRMCCEGFEDCCAELTGAENKDGGLGGHSVVY